MRAFFLGRMNLFRIYSVFSFELCAYALCTVLLIFSCKIFSSLFLLVTFFLFEIIVSFIILRVLFNLSRCFNHGKILLILFFKSIVKMLFINLCFGLFFCKSLSCVLTLNNVIFWSFYDWLLKVVFDVTLRSTFIYDT